MITHTPSVRVFLALVITFLRTSPPLDRGDILLAAGTPNSKLK